MNRKFPMGARGMGATGVAYPMEIASGLSRGSRRWSPLR